MQATIKKGTTHDQIGCSQEYFDRYLKGKKLNIVYESNSGYIRVIDQKGEEWGLFKAQYVREKQKGKALPKSEIPQKQTGSPGSGRHPKPDYSWAIPVDRGSADA
ncbi:hypothetical protein C943_03271 [Mariniradius saccharolyticus AK6]|uniref:Uncharacterized protein n=1 Tax=Mariniradius saccharolyticus AK6 TaxID=1239962 RepID=M7XIC4_9BACT|nr:hypothetical protein [Mariniradius saccharolyticus]EMS34584.1 hypothetical protein C943_03271 [Mariniradius saccharolyticus AK6]